MTDAQKMLALASKSIPDSKWIYDEGNECVRRVADDGGMEEGFDPANNSDQFVDVLAWLLNQRDAPADPLFTILDDDAPPVTAAGLRQAVTDAAVRVAGEIK